MPSALMYVSPTNRERNGWNTEVMNERIRRRNKYREAVRYYEGMHDEQLKTEFGDEDDNVVINMVKMTCDRTASMLFPTVPKFITDDSQIEETEQERWLVKVIKHNGGLSMLYKWVVRGFLSGHTFLRVKPVSRSVRNRKDMYPTISVLDPSTVTVFWRADDVGNVLWYELRYVIGNQPYIQDVVKQDDGTWMIYTYKRNTSVSTLFGNTPTPNGEAGVAYLDLLDFGADFQLVERSVHSSHIPPIIETAHLPHPDDYYGLSEFDQKSLQDAINRLNSMRNRIIRENSEPVDVLTGADADDVVPGGGIVTIANAAAKVTRLELKGDLSGAAVTIDNLVRNYLAVARVVLLNGDPKDMQRVTNASVKILFLDALSKNSVLQAAYGGALEALAMLCVEMGFEMGAVESIPEKIQVKFDTPLPVDQTEIANVSALGLAGGYMSTQTAAIRLGLDPKYEEKARAATVDNTNNLTNTETDSTINNE